MTIEISACDYSPERGASVKLKLSLRSYGENLASLYVRHGTSVDMAIVRIEQRATGEIFFEVDDAKLRKLGFKVSIIY